MSFILDDEFEDEIFFADEPDYENCDSLNNSNVVYANDKRSRFSSFNSAHNNCTAHTTRASSFSSAPIAIDTSISNKFNQNHEDELEFHMELKSLEMLSLIKGPVWAARLREKKEHLSSFERAECAFQRSNDGDVENAVGSEEEDYFLCSTNDFDMSEDSGSQINVHTTTRGFVVEQFHPSPSPSSNRAKAFSSVTCTEDEDDGDDHEEEGDVFIMDL